MNKHFADVASRYVKSNRVLNHTQEVQQLYRRSLKLLASWAIDHDLIAREADKIRKEFEDNRHLDPSSGYVHINTRWRPRFERSTICSEANRDDDYTNTLTNYAERQRD